VAIVYESKREFKIWDYNVTHKQLLIRSPRTNRERENIDIVFWGVEQVALDTSFDGVSLQLHACDAESSLVFTIGIGRVRAAGCKVLANELELFDSSLVYFDRDRAAEEYGTVLVTS
jgi:hypothetical protein